MHTEIKMETEPNFANILGKAALSSLKLFCDELSSHQSQIHSYKNFKIINFNPKLLNRNLLKALWKFIQIKI